MSLFENPDNLKLLQNLLNPEPAKEEDSDLEDAEVTTIKHKLTPASITAQKKNDDEKPKKSFDSPYAVLDNDKDSKPMPSSIDEWQELQTKEDADILDTRKCPEYSISYRQAVGTEDIYLQMGNRTNSSASCEDMIVDILLPDETTAADKMNLSITAQEVDLSTPMYRLKLPLNNNVNVDRCRAKYDKDLQKLNLSLRLQRELDFVNF